MTVRAKPWTLDNNTNSSSCDGTSQTIDGWSGGSTSNFLQQLVDECGSLCEPCQDVNDTDGDGIGDECDDCHNLLGDVNDDLNHDILDIVTTVNIILAGGVGSGEFTECEEADADMDSNGAVNILDVIQIINLILDNRIVNQSGDAEVSIIKKGLDLYLNINSGVNFSGFQLHINGEYPNLYIEDNDHITLESRTKNGKTNVIAYSLDNKVFNNNFAGIKIIGAGSINDSDINIIVSSPAGEALSVVNMGSISEIISDKFGLSSVYPNPFNPSTSITFNIPSNEMVSLNVLDINGKVVDSIYSGRLSAGRHSFAWNADHFSSGLYYFQLRMKSEVSIQKAVLMK